MTGYLFLLPNRKARYYWVDIGLAVCGVILFTLGTYTLGILLLLMALFGMLMRRNPRVVVDEKGVKVTGTWVTFYKWEKFERVLLKDGMLTLDFRNNRLFQEQLLPDSSAAVDENDFNIFCENMIANAKG